MHRRKVLYYSGLAPLGIASLRVAKGWLNPSGFFSELRTVNEETISRLIARQALDPKKRAYGSVPNQYGIDTPGGASSLIVNGIAGWISPESKWHLDPLLLDRMLLAAEYLLRVQHTDGTIDLYSTNFHSTPDLAFVVEPVSLGYGLLSDSSEVSGLKDRLHAFLAKAGQALAVGGIHTPNHRWVVSMALARINALMPDDKYLQRINQWLDEGIDIDADGQYTERSSSVYSPLTNRCLITIARLAGRDDLYRHVRKNLEMSLYYFHPNGEVVTEASTRQDQYKIAWPHAYHYPYLYMCHHDGNDRFGAAVDFIRSVVEHNRLGRDYPFLLEEMALTKPHPSGELPLQYRKVFADSKLARIRDGATDATIVADNAIFFTLMKGPVVLQGVRLASAFFGKGQFRGKELKSSDQGYRLRQELQGPYYQPFHKDLIPESGIWKDMPRENRDQSEVQDYFADVEIRHDEGTFNLHLSVGGTDYVPVAVEINLREGGVLSGAAATDAEGVFLFEGSEVTYSVENETLKIKGGSAAHSWTQLRGALPKLPGTSVYVTGYTPFEIVLSFE